MKRFKGTALPIGHAASMAGIPYASVWRLIRARGWFVRRVGGRMCLSSAVLPELLQEAERLRPPGAASIRGAGSVVYSTPRELLVAPNVHRKGTLTRVRPTGDF